MTAKISRSLSVCSTASTCTNTTASTSSICSTSTNGSKKVRFNNKPKTAIFYKHTATCEEDSIWFTKEHYSRNKKSLSEQGKAWQEKGYGMLLNDVFHSGDRTPLDTFLQLPGQDFLRGAEPYLSDSLRKDRLQARKQAVHAVIDMEISLKLEGNLNQEEKRQEIAKLYAELSAPSKDFAKRLGQADELGDKLGENKDLPKYILPASSLPETKDLTKAEGAPQTARLSISRLVSSFASAISA